MTALAPSKLGYMERIQMRDNNQVTGNTGLFYVCYRLSQLGWNAMPTSRNARGVDVIAYNLDCSEIRGIQVRTLSKRAAVPLSKSLNGAIGDFWIIGDNVHEKPSVFIMCPDEVRKSAIKRVRRRDGEISYWLPAKSYEAAKFRDAWQRLGQS